MKTPTAAPAPEASPAPVHVQSVERVGALPIIADATGKVSSLYSTVRGSNQYVTIACAKTEELLATIFAFLTSNSKVSPYVLSADHFLAAQLEKLEASYPIVKAPTEEVVSSAKQTAQSAVDMIKSKMGPTTAGAA